MKISKKISIVLFFMTCLAAVFAGQSNNNDDDIIYDNLRTIHGRIEIVNHPTLGRTEGRNLQLLFQRVDCRRCVVSTRSDSDGNYSLTVSKGKYRLIARGPKMVNGGNYDLLNPKQKRIVDASIGDAVIGFDVEIVLP